MRCDLGLPVPTGGLRFQNQRADNPARCDLVLPKMHSLSLLDSNRLILVGVSVVENLSPCLMVNVDTHETHWDSLEPRNRNFWSG